MVYSLVMVSSSSEEKPWYSAAEQISDGKE
jgi:hypothetical protein